MREVGSHSREAPSPKTSQDERPDEAIALAAQADLAAFLPLYDRYVDQVYQ